MHDHIINALFIAGQRVIPFTKPSKGNHKKGRPGWNEYVALKFDHALHWHRIYLDHGCPSIGFIFEMLKFTRSIYHKKVKFINNREHKLKKQAIATAFIYNNSRDFWSEISKIRKKTQNNKCLVVGNTDDKAISLCFSDHYKQLFNSVDFPSCEWKELYSYVCNDIVSDCNDRDSFTVPMDAIINAIEHLKPGKSDGFDGLSTDYFINGSPLSSEYFLITCMLSHCFIPTSISVSTMVHIPNGSNKDLTLRIIEELLSVV